MLSLRSWVARLGFSLNHILVNHFPLALEPGTQKKVICDPPSTCSTWTQGTEWSKCFPFLIPWKLFLTEKPTFALKYSKQFCLVSFVIPRITGVHIAACMAYGSAYHVDNKVWIMQFLVVIILYYYQGSFLGSSSFHHLMWNFSLPY